MTLKIDLYDYKQVESSSKLMAEKLGLKREEVEADLLELTQLLEQYRDAQLQQSQGRPTANVIKLRKTLITWYVML